MSQPSPQRQVVIVLPNIRSAHNVGAFFRTSDAAGVSKIYLCGYTAPPPHPKLIKVSLGAEDSVPWEHVDDVNQVIQRLRADGFQLVGLEKTVSSQNFRTTTYTNKVAVFFGKEVDGLVDELLGQMDMVVDIPMRGRKESLNVSVAAGIMLYHLLP